MHVVRAGLSDSCLTNHLINFIYTQEYAVIFLLVLCVSFSVNVYLSACIAIVACHWDSNTSPMLMIETFL